MRGLGGGGGSSLIDHGGLERERKLKTRETKSLRGEKRDTLRQKRKS